MSVKSIRNICCIGAGYVGGPTMSVIAANCPYIEVNVVDINEKRIRDWNSSNLNDLPIFEPGLDKLIAKCRDVNLFFSTNVESCIAAADVIFISVNTPIKKKGLGAGFTSDLKWVESSARQIAKFSEGHTIVVEKSTLPVKTAETIKNILDASVEARTDSLDNQQNKTYSIISNPEFLAEGTAITNLENPDRVLIGGEDLQAIELISDIYKNWVAPEKIITTNIWSSELSKLVANAFLAQRISSINSISALCEATGANIQEVSIAVGTDTRIGNEFLNSGPGFGGSCFKKDILNLVYLCKYYGLSEVANYWENVVKINSWQQNRISKLIIKNLFGTLSDKRIAILGFSFKANTNDTRESPSINISKDLLLEDAKLSIYDPKVSKDKIFAEFEEMEGKDSLQVCESAYEACKEADAVILLTDWIEFKNLDWNSIFIDMRKPAWVFDTRILLNKKYLNQLGFKVWTLGSS